MQKKSYMTRDVSSDLADYCRRGNQSRFHLTKLDQVSFPLSTEIFAEISLFVLVQLL